MYLQIEWAHEVLHTTISSPQPYKETTWFRFSWPRSLISQVSLLLFVPRRGVAAFMARFLSERVFWRCREHSKIWESFGCFLSYRTVIPQCDTTAQLYTTYKLILRRDFPSLSHSSVYTAVRKKNVRKTWDKHGLERSCFLCLVLCSSKEKTWTQQCKDKTSIY